MPPYIPPHLRRAQHDENDRFPFPSSPGRPPQSPRSAHTEFSRSVASASNDVPIWRRSAGAGTSFSLRRPSEPPVTAAPSSLSTGMSTAKVAANLQTEGERYKFNTYARTCLLLQPRPIKADQCEEEREYAQWAGGYVEVTDKLFSLICPCNLVGKPCAFDELEGGCPMIRLCGQLEKWTTHKCPDKGFRTILDIAENVPADYGEKGFGAVNFYDSSDDESGGVTLKSSTASDSLSSNPNNLDNTHQLSYHGKKVSFNDFSCGIKNECGHIHWEVEINCRFVGWSHFKDSPCKQVLEKSRLCSCGHDLESSRQAARDAVKDHERAAVRAGASQPQELGKVWVY